METRRSGEDGNRVVGASGVTAGEVFAARRALRPGRSGWQQAETAYMSILAAGIAGLIAWGLVGSVLVDLARSRLLVWSLPAMYLLLLAALRYCTWQGFVSFSEPDCYFLLDRPRAPRRHDVGQTPPRRARPGFLGGGLVGAVGGLVARGLAGWRGTVGDAGGGRRRVRGRHRRGRMARPTPRPRSPAGCSRLTLPALGVAVLLGWGAGRGGTAALVALWSGPWGWVFLPSLAHSPEGALLATVLLSRCSGSPAGSASRPPRAPRRSRASDAGRGRARAWWLRSTPATRARSCLARRDAKASRPLFGRFRLPAPATPFLAVAWRGALALSRSPGPARVGRGADRRRHPAAGG